MKGERQEGGKEGEGKRFARSTETQGSRRRILPGGEEREEEAEACTSSSALRLSAFVTLSKIS